MCAATLAQLCEALPTVRDVMHMLGRGLLDPLMTDNGEYRFDESSDGFALGVSKHEPV